MFFEKIQTLTFLFMLCYVLVVKFVFKQKSQSWVTEIKRSQTQMGKVLSFKPRVNKVKTGQTLGGFNLPFFICLPLIKQHFYYASIINRQHFIIHQLQ